MRKLVRTYVEALAENVQSRRDAEAIVRQVEQIAALVGESAELRNFLHSPAVPTEAKRELVERLLGELAADEIVRRFLLLLVEHRRTDLLEAIAAALPEELDRRRGIVDVEVRSIRNLSASEQQQLQRVLEQRAGRPVRIHYRIDPTLIGGVQVLIGSTLYDGSLRAQLERLRARMLGG